MRYRGYPEYVPVAKKKEKAAKKLKELMKKNPDIKPVIIEGNTIARTWWGKAWNKNLESYADYSNRIGRGRTYLKHGAVLDLQIKQGEVAALVQGSASKPYSVAIKIEELDKKIWDNMKKACENMLESLEELLAGRFPKELAELFTQKGSGLFPAPKEIRFACTCPDWASMCKHVSAALYGVGTMFDEDPSLFFTLRKAQMDALISEAVKGSAEKISAKTMVRKKGARIIEDAELSTVFGIEIDTGAAQNDVALPNDKSKAKKKAERIKHDAKKTVSKKQKKKPKETQKRQRGAKGNL